MADRKKTSIYAFFTLLLTFLFSVLVNITQAQDSGKATDQALPSFKFGGFLQQQFVADQNPDSPARFSIHRARVGVTGSVTEHITVNLIGGYSEPPDNTPRLVNAFIDFDIHPLLQVRTGQFLLPFGLEGPQPIFLNPAIERTRAIRRINTFTMFRDIGLQISGHQSILSYAFAIVNGAGANNTEQIEPKDVMGRVGLSLTDALQIGLSGHLGHYRPNPASTDHRSRTRAGIDVSYQSKPLLFRGEYLWRKDDQPSGDEFSMNGGYVLAGYRFMENLEAIARYEYFEPDTSLEDDHLNAFTIGANYYFLGNTRLSVNYEIIEDRLNSGLGNTLTVQMQVTL